MCHVSCVTCHVSRVTCYMSHVTCQIIIFFFSDKVVKFSGGGSVIKGAYPSSFCDGNFFSEGNVFSDLIFADRSLILWQTFFCDISFLLSQQYVTGTLICERIFPVKKVFFLHFIHDFKGKVSVRNGIFRYLGALPPPPLDNIKKKDSLFVMASL